MQVNKALNNFQSNSINSKSNKVNKNYSSKKEEFVISSTGYKLSKSSVEVAARIPAWQHFGNLGVNPKISWEDFNFIMDNTSSSDVINSKLAKDVPKEINENLSRYLNDNPGYGQQIMTDLIKKSYTLGLVKDNGELEYSKEVNNFLKRKNIQQYEKTMKKQVY